MRGDLKLFSAVNSYKNIKIKKNFIKALVLSRTPRQQTSLNQGIFKIKKKQESCSLLLWLKENSFSLIQKGYFMKKSTKYDCSHR